MAYTPLKIDGNTTGLVQERVDHLLPNDAYPILENAYLFRETIRRKKGSKFLGRLQLSFSGVALGNFPGAAPPPPFSHIVFIGNLYTAAGIVIDAGKTIVPGSVSLSTLGGGYVFEDSNKDNRLITTLGSSVGYNETITGITIGNPTVLMCPTENSSLLLGDPVYLSGIGGTVELNNQYFFVLSSTANTVTIQANTVNTYTGGGTLQSSPGFVNYNTGDVALVVNNGFQGTPITASFSYAPNLPVMGVLSRELNNENNEETVFFDTKYAYVFTSLGFQEFIPGTTWTGTDFNFFWSTNYWVTPSNDKLFWVTNFSGTSGDPIRYTNGLQWIDFAPTINAAGDKLTQCLAMVPFRSRMVAFRTLEGPNLAGSVQNFQRIRWAAIGNPISDISALFPLAGNVSADAWRDDIRGKGGFLDIPTSQAIMAIGFVRDNLVIYCERSTWQLRYTGRSIAPFQIERVNAELGAESTFSAIQFDTSLVGIGDKGIVQCDSYQSQRIDIKIPDLVFDFHNTQDGNKRVYGIRDFQKRLAYWIYPATFDGAVTDDPDPNIKFPNRRLVYNYENDSWAIFTDSFTALGPFQSQTSTRWQDATYSWSNANEPWIGKPALFPFIAAGNQQGYIAIIDQIISSQESLTVLNISGNSPNVTTLNIKDHNLQTNQVIQITGLNIFENFYDLNNGIFGVVVVDKDNIEIWKLDPVSDSFIIPQVNLPGIYRGGVQIRVRDGFSIQSKRFNFIEEGQNIQLGYVDILMNNTTSGAIKMNVYADYNEENPINTSPQNLIQSTNLPDTFFNSVIPTSVQVARGSTKNWQRIICPQRASFITIEYTLSNTQLIGIEQESDVQIDAQILWIRRAGKQLPAGL